QRRELIAERGVFRRQLEFEIAERDEFAVDAGERFGRDFGNGRDPAEPAVELFDARLGFLMSLPIGVECGQPGGMSADEGQIVVRHVSRYRPAIGGGPTAPGGAGSLGRIGRIGLGRKVSLNAETYQAHDSESGMREWSIEGFLTRTEILSRIFRQTRQSFVQ